MVMYLVKNLFVHTKGINSKVVASYEERDKETRI